MSQGSFYVIFYNSKCWFIAEYYKDTRTEFDLTHLTMEVERNPYASVGPEHGYYPSIELALEEFKMRLTRGQKGWGSTESPPVHEVISLNAEEIKSKIALIKLGQ